MKLNNNINNILSRLSITACAVTLVAGWTATGIIGEQESVKFHADRASIAYQMRAKLAYSKAISKANDKQWVAYWETAKKNGYQYEKIARPNENLDKLGKAGWNYCYDNPYRNFESTIKFEQTMWGLHNCAWNFALFLCVLVPFAAWLVFAVIDGLRKSIQDKQDMAMGNLQHDMANLVDRKAYELSLAHEEEVKALMAEINEVFDGTRCGWGPEDDELFRNRRRKAEEFKLKVMELGGHCGFDCFGGTARVDLSYTRFTAEAKKVIKAQLDNAEEEVGIESWEDTFTKVEKEINNIIAAQTEVIEQQVWHDVNASIANAEIVVATIGK